VVDQPYKSGKAVSATTTDDQVAEDFMAKMKPLIKPDKEVEAKRLLTQVVAMRSHSGPLPPADELQKFEGVQAGFANRIVEMAEKNQAHRHKMESRIINGELLLRAAGQVLAILALILLLCAVCYLAYSGDTKSAATLGALTIVGVVSVFAIGRHFDKDGEREAEPEKLKQQQKSNNRSGRRN
jgi:uncharacterized membrane protein